MERDKHNLDVDAPWGIRHLLQLTDKAGRIDGWVGAAFLFILTSLMLSEVMARFLSNAFGVGPGTVPRSWEISSYLMAAVFTFGAAMTLRGGGHIRVNLLISNLPSKPRRVMEILCSFVAFVATSYLTIAMGLFTWKSYVRGQVSANSGTILWPAMALVVFGLILFAFQFLGRTLRAWLNLPLEDASMRASNPSD